MTKYQSRHKNFGFYADGVRYRFHEGLFVTNLKKLQDVLDNLSDVVKVDEPAPVKQTKSKAESKSKASAK